MIKLSSDVILSTENIKKLIDNHKQLNVPRLQKLEDYYLANNCILQRQMMDPTNLIIRLLILMRVILQIL